MPYLDRTDLVNTTLHTVSRTLLRGHDAGRARADSVSRQHPRRARSSPSPIPFAMLVAFILMNLTNIPANLLSLGAIDFGIIVDGSIVMIENILRRREAQPERAARQIEARTRGDAGRATDLLRHADHHHGIPPSVRLPARRERSCFSPMAYAVGYAPAGRAGVCADARPGPALTGVSPGRGVFWHNPCRLARGAASSLGTARRRSRRPSIALRWSAGARPGGGHVARRHRAASEFLPELDEGSIWLQVQLPPGISLANGERDGRRAAASAARVPRGLVRRDAARPQRRRNRSLDAVAHRGVRWASRPTTLGRRRDEAGSHRSA